MVRTQRVIPLAYQTVQAAGFVRLYKEVFGSLPYKENYSDEWIREKVWQRHLDHGTIVLASDTSGQIVGLACAISLAHAPNDVQGFLKDAWISGHLPEELTPSKTWYMSELGVASSCDTQDVAYALVRDRLISASHAGMAHYVTRTDPAGSISRHIYEGIGARVIGEQDMTDTTQVAVLGSHSTKRMYLFGRASDALGKLVPCASKTLDNC